MSKPTLHRRFFDIVNKVDRIIDLRKFNKVLKSVGIPFYIWPISHWFFLYGWQTERGGKSWGRFKKHYKNGCYCPRRWGWLLLDL